MQFKKVVVLLVCIGAWHVGAEEKNASVDTSDYESFIKSYGLTVEEFQSRVGSTNMFGGSAPVSFSGEGRVKVQFHKMKTDMLWLQDDRSYFQSGWEGNESLIRMGMVARAGRNTILYSKIGFQHSMQGNRWDPSPSEDGAKVQTRHDKTLVTANIHEDMNAGIAVRTVPASFWLRMGAVNWIEASPFTIWKSQPRTFAWEFLPFEIEQPIARYYEYNIAVGEKAGRAAWHKKPLNGIDFESINLPGDLYLNLAWCSYERTDNYEREYIDFAGDLGYTDAFPLKASGIGDTYRHLFHGRLAANKLIGGLTPGLNVNLFKYNDDLFTVQDGNADRFVKQLFNIGSLANPLAMNGTGFYKEPSVFSFDLRGSAAKGLLEIHSDIALSRIDTTFLTWKSHDTAMVPNGDGTFQTVITPDSSARFEKSSSSSDFSPAFYTRMMVKTPVPFQVDVAVVGKGFYSPLSFAATNDAFYAFGSNLVGSGKFISRAEASPYVQNMAGVLLSAMPKLPGYGHFRIAYGQHAQLKPGRDLLYIPYRLNGLDMFTIPHSSYNRWGNGQVDDFPLVGDYGRRLGDESYYTYANSPRSLENGGLSMDYLSTMECFVAYPDAQSARNNLASRSQELSQTRVVGNDTSTTGFVPVNRKFTNNFEVDIAYDISDMIGYPNNLFLGGYAAINNVTTALSPLAVNAKGDKVQLWSMYLRFEPAIALTKKFYLLGILGYENWRSQKSWMNVTEAEIVNKYLTAADSAAFADSGERVFNVPIDFRDAAVGLGFDWEILNRVGLHARAKYMWHKDMMFTRNNWATPIVSLEIKTWF